MENGGVKFDSDKVPVGLLSTEALMQIARVLRFGATKYSSHNWRKGIEWQRLGLIKIHGHPVLAIDDDMAGDAWHYYKLLGIVHLKVLRG